MLDDRDHLVESARGPGPQCRPNVPFSDDVGPDRPAGEEPVGAALAREPYRPGEISLTHAVREHHPRAGDYLAHFDGLGVDARQVALGIPGDLGLVDGRPEGGELRGRGDDRLVALPGRG